MKEKYIKPEMETITLDSEEAILALSNFGANSGDEYEEEEAGVRGRRGTWGNLWHDEKF